MTVGTTQGGPAPAPRKGLSPLAWVGIGCGVIVLIGVVALMAGGYFVKRQVDKFQENPALATAKLVVGMNPELEIVSTDEAAQTITVRNKTTGDVTTVSLDDAKEGKFKFETAEGEATMEAGEGGLTMTGPKGETMTLGAGEPQDLPSWVPTYPGGSMQSSYDAKTAEGRTAAFVVTSSDVPDNMLTFYEEQLEAAGFEVQKMTTVTGDTAGGTLSATSGDGKRSVTVAVSTSEGMTQALVSYSEQN